LRPHRRADSGHIETNDVPAQILAMDVGERGRFEDRLSVRCVPALGSLDDKA
jgi:hypothetical protein